jgi:DNA-binding transcriptional ArsR family regulator
MPIAAYEVGVARAATTSGVRNAIPEANRRDILNALVAGEKAVGSIVNDLSMSQPQVSKHLRVFSGVGLVRCRVERRRRLCRTAWNQSTFGVARVAGQVRAGVERPGRSVGRLPQGTTTTRGFSDSGP